MAFTRKYSQLSVGLQEIYSQYSVMVCTRKYSQLSVGLQEIYSQY